MDEYEHYFEPIIPDYIWYICLAIVSIVSLMSVVFCTCRRDAFKWVVASVLLAYLILVYCNTVFLRVSLEETKYELTLFWSYTTEDFKVQFIGNVLNIVLFAPIGFLFKFLFKNQKCWIVIFLAFCISASIESLQLIMKRGVCEFDDMLHNTFGALIGFLFAVKANKFIYNSQQLSG